MVGNEAGIGHLVALVHYVAAVLAALVFPWAPLISRVLMSADFLLDGWYLPRLAD